MTVVPIGTGVKVVTVETVVTVVTVVKKKKKQLCRKIFFLLHLCEKSDFQSIKFIDITM